MLYRLKMAHGPPKAECWNKEKDNYAGSKTLPASIKEKETQWPEAPWVSPTKKNLVCYNPPKHVAEFVITFPSLLLSLL